jgi:molybdenum cofactor cytidylyltransferase
MSDSVHGVVLAAGESARMGQPKALLTIGSESFLQRAVRTLYAAGCDRVHVVTGPDAGWADAATAGLDVDLVANPVPGSEQIDSLRLVLQRLPGEVRAVVVLPVDLPLVTPETVRLLIDTYRGEPAPLLLPFHGAVAGHPVLLDRALFAEILETVLEEGLRSLILGRTQALREVRVIDPGILIDIDTPDDYRRHIQQK